MFLYHSQEQEISQEIQNVHSLVSKLVSLFYNYGIAVADMKWCLLVEKQKLSKKINK